MRNREYLACNICHIRLKKNELGSRDRLVEYGQYTAQGYNVCNSCYENYKVPTIDEILGI